MERFPLLLRHNRCDFITLVFCMVLVWVIFMCNALLPNEPAVCQIWQVDLSYFSQSCSFALAAYVFFAAPFLLYKWRFITLSKFTKNINALRLPRSRVKYVLCRSNNPIVLYFFHKRLTWISWTDGFKYLLFWTTKAWVEDIRPHFNEWKSSTKHHLLLQVPIKWTCTLYSSLLDNSGFMPHCTHFKKI